MWKSNFGEVEGASAYYFALENQRGMEVTITNYGGSIVALKVPDRDGQIDDIVLGFGSLQGYLNTHPYFGSIVDRYANRIGKV